ncbi:hypothetical protein BJV82DRAFT_584802 [Fennellomyces sp. T-0311]|nr:hypothetical protein BJV82DRAFT_584802 [Fennellomyces sp. T-0311]
MNGNVNKRNSIPDDWSPASPPRAQFEPWGKRSPETPRIFYEPTPAPQTVVVHDTPGRSKDACCWGCIAAITLCFGIKECCTR